MDKHCTESAAKRGTRADPSPALAGFEQRIKGKLDDGKQKAVLGPDAMSPPCYGRADAKAPQQPWNDSGGKEGSDELPVRAREHKRCG